MRQLYSFYSDAFWIAIKSILEHKLRAFLTLIDKRIEACLVALDFGDQHEVSMPITSEVVGVCHDGNTAQEAYRGLLRQHESTRE